VPVCDYLFVLLFHVFALESCAKCFFFFFLILFLISRLFFFFFFFFFEVRNELNLNSKLVLVNTQNKNCQIGSNTSTI
jgi:hypothetical protein